MAMCRGVHTVYLFQRTQKLAKDSLHNQIVGSVGIEKEETESLQQWGISKNARRISRRNVCICMEKRTKENINTA